MDNEIIKYFPMPEFRPKQKEVLEKCWELLESGKKLILLQAPVGFGKSAVNTALCRYYTPSIYTTPQLNLIDQIINDKHLGKYFVEIKGRDNYKCAKDNYMTPVKHGLCKREKNVIPERCNWLHECPYYSQKIKAIQSPMVLTSLAYFIVDAYVEPPNFNNRKLVVIDEGHFLAEHVANQVSLECSKRSLPKQVYERCKDLKNVEKLIEEVEIFLSSIQTKLDIGYTLTDEEVAERIKAEDWLARAKIFMDTEIIAEWVWTKKHDGYIAKPVYSRWFMENMIWSRGEKFIISTATIIKPNLWIKENGVDLCMNMNEVVFIDVSSTFPPERRKVIDMSIGSMRYDEQEHNIKHMVRILEYIIETNSGKNIAVHFPSYSLAEKTFQMMTKKENIYLPNSDNRDIVLESWKRNGGVFFAIAYHEGQDWKYDICNIQVLAKTLYPDVSDPIIEKRLEKKDYQWLMWTALVKCLQAYGRAIRAEDDYMEFYVLDSKFWDLIRINWKSLPKWFKEVVPENRKPKKYREKTANS